MKTRGNPSWPGAIADALVTQRPDIRTQPIQTINKRDGFAQGLGPYRGAGYIDHFEEAIGDYAVDYADQVERDYENLRQGRP